MVHLGPGLAHLPGGGCNAANQRKHAQYGRCYFYFVPLNELGAAVAEGGWPSRYRQALQVPPDVFGELLHRGIALLRLLTKSHQHDRV